MPGKARQFYAEVLGLEVVMDQGWIVTLAASSQMASQITIASEDGSGILVPDISVEADALDEALRDVRAFGLVVGYGPTSEPRHVRRL